MLLGGRFPPRPPSGLLSPTFIAQLETAFEQARAALAKEKTSQSVNAIGYLPQT